MVDTSDLREQVARTIRSRRPLLARGECEELADIALAVAAPIIRADERRKVLPELAAMLEAEPSYPVKKRTSRQVADWLRAQDRDPT